VRRLFDPRWRGVNKRGQILLIFGLLWVSIGFSVLDQPIAAGQEDLLFSAIPVPVRAGAWMLTGIIAIAHAMRPLTIHSDDPAFFALYIMPAERVLIFALGYIDYHTPSLDVGPFSLFSSAGYSRGLYSALVWLIVAAAVMVCARWPDPPSGDLERT
jgi:uncharacterized membrane-anchored protein